MKRTARLTPAELAIAAELTAIWMERRGSGQIQKSRFDTTEGGLEQNELGAIGQVAWCVLTGHTIPPARVMADTWKRGDFGRVEVRSIDRRHKQLLVYDEDEGPGRDHDTYALVYVWLPNVELLGVIDRARAWELKERPDPRFQFKYPGWVVDQGLLRPFEGPPPREEPRCPHRMPLSHRCYSCEPLDLRRFPPRERIEQPKQARRR